MRILSVAAVFKALAVLIPAAFIGACGGGGGGEPPTTTPPPVDTQLNWDDDNWDEKDWV